MGRSREGSWDPCTARSEKAGLRSGIWEESGGASGVSDLEGGIYLCVQDCGCLTKGLDCNR